MSLRYYLVPTKQEAPGRVTADVPDGTSWVGMPGPDNVYLVATPDDLSEWAKATEVAPAQLATRAAARGLDATAIAEQWFVQ